MSGFADNENPSIFNTAQILLGLLRTYRETGDERYANAAKKAADWLLSELQNSGWKNYAYVSGFVPSYYTRVIWPTAAILKKFNLPGLKDLDDVLTHFCGMVNPDFAVVNWGFYPDRSAFLHTIAYTARGFLESGLILDRQDAVLHAQNIALRLAKEKSKHGKTAGSYDISWQGDYSYRCVTGILQCAVLCFRLAEVGNRQRFYPLALDFLAEAATIIPHRDPLTPAYALPGSVPLWGKYMRMKYPNWAAKFWLDAALYILQKR